MIRKGQIVTNFTRTWFGVFEKWYKESDGLAYLSYCLDSRGTIYKMSSGEIVRIYPATDLEREKFKKTLIKAGFTYYRGKVIREL